jgi:hypothetical protein
MNKIDEFLKDIGDLNPEAMYPTDMKEAIIGYVERFGMEPQILLDREKCIQCLIKDGMPEEDAEEFFEFNTIGSFMGELGTPCFATLVKHEPELKEFPKKKKESKK